MKGLIVYKGKYGATAQYAEWLAAELQLPVMEAGDVTTDIINDLDYIVIGSSVYVGKLQVRDWLKRFVPVLTSKSTFFFIVCATPPDRTDKLKEIAINNIPASIGSSQHIFFLPGRLIKKKLSFMDRFILNMGARMQRDPAERERMLRDFDHVRREHLNPLVTGIHNEISQSIAQRMRPVPWFELAHTM